MSTILFDSASTRDLISPDFAVPLVPGLTFDDVPAVCEVCEVVHLPAHRRGPDALDMAFEHGRSAALECRHHRILPPVGLGSAEVTAFFAGVDAGRDEYHAEAMAEIDGAMAAAY